MVLALLDLDKILAGPRRGLTPRMRGISFCFEMYFSDTQDGLTVSCSLWPLLSMNL